MRVALIPYRRGYNFGPCPSTRHPTLVTRYPPLSSICGILLLAEQEPAEGDRGDHAGQVGEQPGRNRVPGPGDVN